MWNINIAGIWPDNPAGYFHTDSKKPYIRCAPSVYIHSSFGIHADPSSIFIIIILVNIIPNIEIVLFQLTILN